MLPEAKNFFKPIETPEKRKKVFDKLSKKPILFLCKAKPHKAFHLEFIRFDGEDKIDFRPPSEDSGFEADMEKVMEVVPVELIVQFECDDEKYFFRAQCTPVGKKFRMVFDGPLYILQRRQNYRTKIPPGFKTTVTLRHLESDVVIEASSIDISIKGCRLLIHQSKTSFHTDDHFEISLSFPRRKKIKIPAYLRHFYAREQGLELGFEFHRMPHEVEQEIFGVLMEIYRDYVSKVKG